MLQAQPPSTLQHASLITPRNQPPMQPSPSNLAPDAKSTPPSNPLAGIQGAIGAGAGGPPREDALAFLQHRTQQSRMINAFFENAKRAVSKELQYRKMHTGVTDQTLDKALQKEVANLGKSHQLPEWAAQQHMRKAISELESQREAEKAKLKFSNIMRPWRWNKIRRARKRKAKGDIAFVADDGSDASNEDGSQTSRQGSERVKAGNVLLTNIFNNIIEESKKPHTAPAAQGAPVAAASVTAKEEPAVWEVLEKSGTEAAAIWEPVPALKQRDYLFDSDRVRKNKIRSQAMCMPKPGDPQPGAIKLAGDRSVAYKTVVQAVDFDADVQQNHGITSNNSVPMPDYQHK